MERLAVDQGDLKKCVLPDGTRCRFAEDGIQRAPHFGDPAIICNASKIMDQAKKMNMDIKKHLKRDGTLRGVNATGMHMTVASHINFLEVRIDRELKSSGHEISEMTECVQGLTTENFNEFLTETRKKIGQYREKYIIKYD